MYIKMSCVLLVLLMLSCTTKVKKPEKPSEQNLDIVAMLDTVFTTEQQPISRRDAYIDSFGVDSKKAQEQQEIYERNHAINEKKVRHLLDTQGWPDVELIGERGNRTICNVIQHADNEVRILYLPMMRKAVADGDLSAQYLVRAEDRIATERGDLQVYGGQMKYYPETKSFNVWPVYDPENIDKRRAAIGLGPISEFLKMRFDFEWDLEEQIKRTAAFEAEKKKKLESE
ncbi:DUF6624 domain-containing protein [Lutimonas sp.]|uniref:DUF6624 domain-containing protein n=1 Tax=Lutimonas sp. TaxID=1872403 RepID=UPI003D9AEF31